MPRPIFKKIDLIQLINKSLDFIKLTSKNSINLVNNSKVKFINGDEDQLNRVFINLIKNLKSLLKNLSRNSLILKEILT